MSSEPFRLGLEIMGRIPATGCHIVLRTRTREEMIRAIMRTREQLRVGDLILVREMGFRPDHPISTPAWFAEVVVKIGAGAEEKAAWMKQLVWRVYEGKQRARIIV